MANGTLKVQNIETSSGSGTITLGQSGETIALGSGVTSKLNQPAFEARLNSDQSVNHNTATKVQCGDEIFDTDNAYDNATNYRFTPQVGGKYYCYFGLRGFAGGSDPDGVRFMVIAPYKNGSLVRNYNSDDTDSNELRAPAFSASAVIELNGSTDYLEFYGKVYAENLSSTGVKIITDATYFGAYRIGAE